MNKRMCMLNPGLLPGLSHNLSLFRGDGHSKHRRGRLRENEILMPFLPFAGLTRSSACFSLLENSLTAEAIETEEISTLSSHKLNQGSHDSLLRDLGVHCYLQGTREGRRWTLWREEGRDLACETKESLTFIYLLQCICGMAWHVVLWGVSLCTCVCVCPGNALCFGVFYVNRLPPVEGQTQSIEAINVAWRLEGRPFLRGPRVFVHCTTHTWAHTHTQPHTLAEKCSRVQRSPKSGVFVPKWLLFIHFTVVCLPGNACTCLCISLQPFLFISPLWCLSSSLPVCTLEDNPKLTADHSRGNGPMSVHGACRTTLPAGKCVEAAAHPGCEHTTRLSFSLALTRIINIREVCSCSDYR